MIRLKNLLLEQDFDKDLTNVIVPKVLFLGDAYTKFRSSYAKQLISNKIVTGKIVAVPGITAKQLARLTTKYTSKSYNIVSIYLGDIIKKQSDLNKLEKQLNDIITAAGAGGATVVLVQNPDTQYGNFKDALNIVKQLNVDISVDINADLSVSEGHSALVNKWIDDVNSQLNINLLTPTEKLKQQAKNAAEEPGNTNQPNGSSSPEASNPNITPISVTGPLPIVSPYGRRRSGNHYGIDYHCVVGTTIYMAMGGVVQRADNRNATGWGNMIQIKHDDGAVTRYAHMSRMDVTVGSRVEIGDLIGLTGGKRGAPGAGNSTGPHLHWEWLPSGGSAKDGANVAGNYFSASPITPKEEPAQQPEEEPAMLASIADGIIKKIR